MIRSEKLRSPILASPIRILGILCLTAAGCSSSSTPSTPPPPDVPDPVACPATDPAGFMTCVSRDRYVNDVTFVAGDFRSPGSAHWMQTQDHCAAILESHGFVVERHDYGSGTNVVGTLTGTDMSNEQIVIGAHYDHLSTCLGADDNATGVAGMLEIARVLSSGSAHRRTLVAACWDEEERDALGSKAWATRAKSQGVDVVQYVNFDMIGFASDAPNSQNVMDGFEPIFPDQFDTLTRDQFRGNFLWTFFDKQSQPFARTLMSQSRALSRSALGIQIPTALLENAGVQNSDHASFWQQDWPAAHIGDTGDLRNANYHCKNGTADTVATLNHDYAYDVIRASTSAIATMLAAAEPALDTSPGITTCNGFCARAASFGAAEVECMTAVFDILDVTLPASCGAVTGPATCNTCAEDLSLTSLHCEGLADLCL